MDSNSPADAHQNQGLAWSEFPTGVLTKIFDNLPVESLATCRLICSKWNNIILVSELLDLKSCFVFDGRRDDASATKCADYMETSETRNYLWSHLKFRRVGPRQSAWIFTHLENDPDFTLTVSTLELLNSTLNWASILQLMIECENLEVFIDKQDMYCWDYQTFNSGIEENETIEETSGFLHLNNKQKLDHLKKIRIVRIHRSQLTECTTYLKILCLKCCSLQELEINTDQNFAPQRGVLFYTHLAHLLRKTGEKLRILKFPYKIVCPTYDVRTTDEHRLFQEFLSFIVENRWDETIHLPALEDFEIQYGFVPVEGQSMKQKLLPFLQSIPKLKTFYVGCIHLEAGMERFLLELISLCRPSLKIQFGIFMSDAAGVPNIFLIQNSIKSLSLTTYREQATELANLIPMFGIEEFTDLQDFQYFSKNHTFRNFDLELLIESFDHLKSLNLVDHNARLETRHSCEALATIEDSDVQLLIKKLRSLESIQLIGNMTFLTDVGLSGISPDGCKRMLATKNFTIIPGDLIGLPLSSLKGLKSIVFRGFGIKVTDVSARLAFQSLPHLNKLHVFGCHQVTSDARAVLCQRYSVGRGCDVQI